jgi:hypothetical protein
MARTWRRVHQRHHAENRRCAHRRNRSRRDGTRRRCNHLHELAIVLLVLIVIACWPCSTKGSTKRRAESLYHGRFGILFLCCFAHLQSVVARAFRAMENRPHEQHQVRTVMINSARACQQASLRTCAQVASQTRGCTARHSVVLARQLNAEACVSSDLAGTAQCTSC